MKIKPPAEESSCKKEGFGYGLFYFVLGILLICVCVKKYGVLDVIG